MLKNPFETTILVKKNSLSSWDSADVFLFLSMFRNAVQIVFFLKNNFYIKYFFNVFKLF